MAKRKKIQDNDTGYNCLRRYVCGMLKRSYRRTRFIGKERIPKDGAVILAPNHTGALLDALIILTMAKQPVVFLARADIFKNPKLAKIFRFFKMMPVMRMRDGFEEVKKNNRTIEIAADVLKSRVPICIFPEGTHQTKRSMLPLSKGIFRIALQAKSIMPDTPLYIVPVGVRYGNWFRYRSTVTVQIGKAINVGEFISQNEEKTPQEQINHMRKLLDERMKENIFYIPNDEAYDATAEICAAMSAEQLKKLKGQAKEADIMTLADNMTVKKLGEIRAKDERLAEKLVSLGNEAFERRNRKRISLKSVARRSTPLCNIMKSLLLLATLPYTLAAMAAVSPTALLNSILLKKFKDRAFHNSVRFVINLIIWPLLLAIYAVIAFVFLPAHWALLAVVCTIPAPAVAQDAWRAVRIMISDCKLCSCRALRNKYDEIREIILNN